MKIDFYNFGEIHINGRPFREDLILFPDRIKEKWWRKEGHELNPEDVLEIVDYGTDILIVGTGYSGLMKIKDTTKELLGNEGITLIEKNSREAVKIYNELIEKEQSKKVVLAIHLTC